jgi:hypothetical protein
LVVDVDVLPLQRQNLRDTERCRRSDQDKRSQHQFQLVDDREGLSCRQNDRIEIAGCGLPNKANGVRLFRPRQKSDPLGVLVDQTDDLSDLRAGLVPQPLLSAQLP